MENKLSLYNIKCDFIELFEKAENEELTQEEIEKQGNNLALALQNKSISVIGYIRNTELMSDAIKSEIERLTAMKKAIDNKTDKFKEYVKVNMQDLGLEKIQTELGTLVVTKNPASVEITDENLIPTEYIKEKVTKSVDKTAIKNAIKNGQEVQGAILIEDKTSLRIK